jgi:hypothetical protein
MSRVFDQLFGGGEHLERLCRLARMSKVASCFADAAELQERAKSIEGYSSLVVPGLLQTEAYTRAPTQAAQPFTTSFVIEGHVRTRMDRAQQGCQEPCVLRQFSERIGVSAGRCAAVVVFAPATVARIRTPLTA